MTGIDLSALAAAAEKRCDRADERARRRALGNAQVRLSTADLRALLAALAAARTDADEARAALTQTLAYVRSEVDRVAAERDTAESALAAARAEVGRLTAALALTEQRPFTVELQQARAELAEARRALAKAERWIANCVDPVEVGFEVKAEMLDTLLAASRPSLPDAEATT